MTINITYDGKPYRVIKKENAYVLSVSLSNDNKDAVLDLDALKKDNGLVHITENLPNGKHLELGIVTSDAKTMNSYRGLTTIHASYQGVEITATL